MKKIQKQNKRLESFILFFIFLTWAHHSQNFQVSASIRIVRHHGQEHRSPGKHSRFLLDRLSWGRLNLIFLSVKCEVSALALSGGVWGQSKNALSWDGLHANINIRQRVMKRSLHYVSHYAILVSFNGNPEQSRTLYNLQRLAYLYYGLYLLRNK